MSADYIRQQERPCVYYGPVDVTFSGEMDNTIRLSYKTLYETGVFDCSFYERIPAVFRQVFQVFGVPGISEGIEIDDSVIRVFIKDVPDEIRADKAASACHEELHYSSLNGLAGSFSYLTSSTSSFFPQPA